MILDKESLLSDAQAITATAASTNIIDLRQASRYLGVGEQLWLYVFVNTTFESGGATTLTVDLQQDDNSGFSSATTLLTSGVIAKATLVAKYVVFKVPLLAGITERYIRLNYTVATGPFTAGAMTAAIVKDVNQWFAHDDGITFP